MRATVPQMKRRILNVLKGRITDIIERTSGIDLVVEFAPGVKLVSSLTPRSFAAMNPRRGQAACAVIPALDVVVAPRYPEGKQPKTS